MQKISDFPGLTRAEANRLLIQNGFNELSVQQKKNGFTILVKVLKEPMLILLLSAGIIYLFMGEPTDSLMLLVAIIAVIGLTLYQEIKTENTLAALRDLSSPRALVIRDGQQESIASREVVVGDIIYIHEGDRVPADAVILSGENLSVDESLLSGESISVRKVDWDKKSVITRPGGDDLPFVYSGTMVTSGRGVIQVRAIGLDTEIGRIGQSLASIEEEDTFLHQETAKIVRLVATIAISLCVIVFLFFALVKHDMIAGLLSGLTLAMAILPEEFPVVLTVFLTLGAWRISKHNVLTRRVAAIETLGAATVLCTDKTGTLTLNKFELSSLYTNCHHYPLDEAATNNLSDDAKKLLEIGVLASQKDLFDPLEKELQIKADSYLANNLNHNHLELVEEYPLTKDLLALSYVWRSNLDNSLIVASKGAPEAIISLCHLSEAETKEILSQVLDMSNSGLRVLGVAQADFTGTTLPTKQQEFAFKFVGLLGFIDQIRPNVAASIKLAQTAGIRVIMITGDYPGTAQSIAKKIGLKDYDNYLTGSDLEKMSVAELAVKIKTVNIFARVFPEQKLLIVEALKANSEVVAMTGDGVNDAPALKSAHIGISMGKRGTDVAHEASSLILLDDDFSSIVMAVSLGRRIYSNLKRSMGYLLAVHVPIAGMAVLPIFFGWPIILFPAHIAFMELIIDPACSLVFEAQKEDGENMHLPPRNINRPMFTYKTVIFNLAQGFSALIGISLIFMWALKSGRGEAEIRSLVFVSLVIANLMLIVMNLSWRSSVYKILSQVNYTLLVVTIGALLCLGAVLYLPGLTNLFHMAPLNGLDLLVVVIVIALSLSWFEISKLLRKRKQISNLY